MKVSVISPVHRVEWLDQILDSYVRQDLSDDKYEVIFLATNPANWQEVVGKVTAAQQHWKRDFRVVDCRGKSNCQSRNVGATIAHGDILVFVDGDQILYSKLAATHLEFHSVGKIAVGLGICNIDVHATSNGLVNYVVLPGGRGIRDKYELRLRSILLKDFCEGLYPHQALGYAFFQNPDKLTDYVNLVTRNCSVLKDVFWHHGGFDEAFGYSETSTSRGWEDTELGIRLRECEFGTVPAWTIHPLHTSPGANKDGGWGNMLLMCKKHPWFLEERRDWFERVRYPIAEVKKDLNNA